MVLWFALMLLVIPLCEPATTTSSSLMPLPRSAAAASVQAVAATRVAVESGHRRVQCNVLGDGIELPGPLPLRAFCERFVDVIGAERRVHIFFDSEAAARAWQQSEASCRCRADVLGQGGMAEDDGVLLVVSPNNCAPVQVGSDFSRGEPDAPKLEALQQLICGAGCRPVVIANPQLEALLLTSRVGSAAPPMFLSDFEHAFFMVEAVAKRGQVTAVRRLWRGEWETYKVTEAGVTSTGVPGDSVKAGGVKAAPRPSVEVSTLWQSSHTKPRAAETLVRHVRRQRRARRRLGSYSPGGSVPSDTDEQAWAAEDGWREP